MSRTEPGVKESFKNYTENLDEYEYMISVRPKPSFESEYALNRAVIDEMYQDGLLCPFVYMSLHRENEDNRPESPSFPYVCFFLYLLLLSILYAYSP
jgi:hypothetical protein